VSFLAPVAGLVIRYSYLWRDEFLKGREEGVKDRPCALILVTRTQDKEEIVTVLPITSKPLRDPDGALEIPRDIRLRLGSMTSSPGSCWSRQTGIFGRALTCGRRNAAMHQVSCTVRYRTAFSRTFLIVS
jgi:hypothetical protein